MTGTPPVTAMITDGSSDIGAARADCRASPGHNRALTEAAQRLLADIRELAPAIVARAAEISSISRAAPAGTALSDLCNASPRWCSALLSSASPKAPWTKSSNLPIPAVDNSAPPRRCAHRRRSKESSAAAKPN
jgi:hypothetical protein